MGLLIVEDKCVVDTGNTNGTIVVRSDSTNSSSAYPELSSADARRQAIMKAAQLGVPDPRINGSVQIYPVDEKGEEIKDPANQKVAWFQADIPVVRRLV